jgi:hypothetical protein
MTWHACNGLGSNKWHYSSLVSTPVSKVYTLETTYYPFDPLIYNTPKSQFISLLLYFSLYFNSKEAMRMTKTVSFHTRVREADSCSGGHVVKAQRVSYTSVSWPPTLASRQPTWSSLLAGADYFKQNTRLVICTHETKSVLFCFRGKWRCASLDLFSF